MAGEPAQHAAADLLCDRSNRFWRQCRGLAELDPTGFEQLEHPVEDAGWVVVGAELRCGGDGTCRYEPAAVEGGSNVPHFVVLRAEPYGVVTASSSITIRGPRNTHYDSR